MACNNDTIPVNEDFCFFAYGVDEIVIFWVDENELPIPIEQYTASLFRFRAGRKLDSTILLDAAGTIEDRVDPDDMVTKKAAVIQLTEADKALLLIDGTDASRDGTVYLTNISKMTPIIEGLHDIHGGA
jgi:hypothetical protein